METTEVVGTMEALKLSLAYGDARRCVCVPPDMAHIVREMIKLVARAEAGDYVCLLLSPMQLRELCEDIMIELLGRGNCGVTAEEILQEIAAEYAHDRRRLPEGVSGAEAVDIADCFLQVF